MALQGSSAEWHCCTHYLAQQVKAAALMQPLHRLPQAPAHDHNPAAMLAGRCHAEQAHSLLLMLSAFHGTHSNIHMLQQL